MDVESDLSERNLLGLGFAKNGKAAGKARPTARPTRIHSVAPTASSAPILLPILGTTLAGLSFEESEMTTRSAKSAAPTGPVAAPGGQANAQGGQAQKSAKGTTVAPSAAPTATLSVAPTAATTLAISANAPSGTAISVPGPTGPMGPAGATGNTGPAGAHGEAVGFHN